MVEAIASVLIALGFLAAGYWALFWLFLGGKA